MVTPTKANSVLSLCSLKWLLAVFVLLGCTQAFSQEVTFTVKRDTTVADTNQIRERLPIFFNINGVLNNGDTLYKNQLKQPLKILTNDQSIKVFYYELYIKTKDGKITKFWRHGNIIDKEIKRYIKNVKSGDEITFSYFKIKDIIDFIDGETNTLSLIISD
jgi:hypothetical protein